ncbi:hypothetical protein [Candidatus Nitrosotalea okcheonensis]|uniref:Uncharacterized protein n=1 Tax=Candidatus Nitrosotalea okcheonensis TaxID=1903276 RepID=A0A2H1FHQ9_9ARCH|nr:hypothetical protein [Candidatus Nitrosotalea okcheonensis]SMH72301.1 protein of unknown function [Candidatus Nitrosotalea okcheonensis]
MDNERYDGKVDQVILFVDGKPFLSSDLFWPRPEIVQLHDLPYKNPAIGWGFKFFTGFFENGCHKISIGGINENSKFTVDGEFILCKKPSIL